MATVSLTDAKVRLRALVDKVIVGRTLVITRRGRAAARLRAVTAPKLSVDIEALRAVTAAMPLQAEGAGAFMRAMRDDARY